MTKCRISSPQRHHAHTALAHLAHLALAVLLFAPFAARAVADADWELVSPDGGTVVQLVRGDDLRTVYAVGEQGAVFRSTDGGEHWETVVTHLNGAPIRGFGPSPVDPDLLLADNFTIHRSTDGGVTWQQVNEVFSGATSFAFAPSDPNRVYAAGVTVWRSDDAGATWTNLSQGAEEVVVDPGDPDRLWAGHAGGVAISEDGGASWRDQLTSVSVAHLALDGDDEPHSLWAAASSGLWVSRDEGESWQQSVPPAPVRESIRQVAVRPRADGEAYVVAGRYRGQSLVLEADVVFLVGAYGEEWIELAERPTEINALLVRREEPVFAPALLAPRGQGVVEGPQRTHGRIGSIGLKATAVGHFAIPDLAPSTLYATDRDRRELLVSDQGGRLWQRLPATLDEVHPAPSDPSRLYGFGTGGLLRSDDGGESFDTVPLPEALGAPHAFAVDPADPESIRLVLRFTPSCLVGLPSCPPAEYRLYASDDAGTGWHMVETPTAPSTALQAVAFDPRRAAGEPAREYLLTSEELLVHDPAASGADWVPTAATPPFLGAFDLAVQPTEGGGVALYVSTMRPGEQVWRSLDEGAGWTLLDDGLPEASLAYVFAASPRPDGRVVAALLNNGVYELVDGTRWEKFGDGLERVPLERLAVAAGSDVVFALANGHLYRRGVATDCTPPSAGAASPTLCLGAGDRFRVEVDWRDFQGGFGAGVAETLTADAGYFWFFRQANAELAVKVLDGRPVNGNRWVFYGSLTNVPFDLTVTDLEAGDYRTYTNPARNFASRGDTAAFVPGGIDQPPVPGLRAEEEASPAAATVGCGTEPGVLCLDDGRFRVEADWEDFQGGTGEATAVPLSTDSGYLWFFRASNVELFVKVLDGRPVNGQWWVFYGSLSNVRFELRVTDTLSGVTRTYENPSGSFASRGDVEAFDPLE